MVLSMQEVFFENGNLKLVVRKNASKRPREECSYTVKNLYCQIRPSAQPDDYFEKLSLLKIHL